MGRLPESWIAPPATREVRGWVRHRAKLVGLRSCLKNQIHAVLAGACVQVPMSDLFGAGGRELLAPHGSAAGDHRLDFEIDPYAQLVAAGCAPTPATWRSRPFRGVRPLPAAVSVAATKPMRRCTNQPQVSRSSVAFAGGLGKVPLGVVAGAEADQVGTAGVAVGVLVELFHRARRLCCWLQLGGCPN